MAKFVYGLNQSLDGYVDHDNPAFGAPGPRLFRHFVDHMHQVAGCVYGRRLYEIMSYWQADGFLYLADRLSDMIIVGGANIYPAEVEAALDSFPGVRSSAVIGLPDDNTGNRLHAIIDRPAGPADERALLAHLNEHLVRYKTPRTFEWVNQPLRDEAGKVRRSALRKERLAG